VALLAVAGIVAVLLTRGNSPHTTDAAGTSHQTTTHRAAPLPAATTTHAPAATTTPRTAATTTTGVTQPTTSTAVPAGALPTPAAFITSYYQLIPGNLQAAWPQMTSDYQVNHAKGWAGYTNFWSQFSSVSLSNVSTTGPSSAVATIHYVYKSGGTTTEVTNFTLVQQNGHWEIASST
jgi:hypothetical protein